MALSEGVRDSNCCINYCIFYFIIVYLLVILKQYCFKILESV